MNFSTKDLLIDQQRKPLLIPHPDEPDVYSLQIDNSSLEVFTTCPRSAEYKLVQSRTSPTRSPLVYGGAIHAGLEAHYRNEPEENVYRAVIDHFDKEKFISLDWRTPDRAIDTLQRYRKRYLVDEFNPAPEEIEIPFSLPLTSFELDDFLAYGPELLTNLPAPSRFEAGLDSLYVKRIDVYWTGKIDILTRSQGELTLIDHKTTSMVGPTFWKDFELSSQFIGYVWAGQQIKGESITSAWVNAIIGRAPTKTGVGTDFERNRFRYTAEQVQEWEDETKMIVGDFIANLCRGKFPKHTKWCVGKYGVCAYHDVCSLPSKARQSALSSDIYANNTWSPLGE